MKITIVVKNGKKESKYRLEIEAFRTVLDALETIRAKSDPGLLYRHSCHHGSCGTCGAIIDGVPRLMCATRIEELDADEIVVEPLKKAGFVGGVAVWPGPLFEGLPDTKYTRLSSRKGSQLYSSSPNSAHEAMRLPERLEDCIECGLCVEACPVGAGFKGPAALAAAAAEIANNPLRKDEMLNFAAQPDGAAKCGRFFECSRVCPRGVAPGRKITELLSALGSMRCIRGYGG